MSHPLQKFDITAQEIDDLVAEFYRRIRAHPMLSVVFGRAITPEDGPEWRVHEAKIAAFWRNAVGMDRAYDGNPMQVHSENRDIQPGMFSTWLDLFEATARDVLSADRAERMIALAHRIGQGLRYGVTTRDVVKGEPPKLF